MDDLKYVDEQQARWTIRPNELVMQAECGLNVQID